MCSPSVLVRTCLVWFGVLSFFLFFLSFLCFCYCCLEFLRSYFQKRIEKQGRLWSCYVLHFKIRCVLPTVAVNLYWHVSRIPNHLFWDYNLIIVRWQHVWKFLIASSTWNPISLIPQGNFKHWIQQTNLFPFYSYKTSILLAFSKLAI